MSRTVFLTPTQVDAITAVAWLAIAIGAGLVVHRLVDWLVARRAARNSAFAAALLRRTRRPAAFILPALAVLLVAPYLDLPDTWKSPTVRITGLITVAAVSWALIAFVRLWGDVTVARHRIDVEDNLVARQLGTRVDILTRTAVTIVIVVALAVELMTFPPIRAFGATLLASAGLAGIVVGLAARPLFENLVAGVQLALTQPIRIDDVVIVEKQYGRIEELHATYVVVRLWDLRRMILPLSYFITTPFENWTTHTANLIGEVFVSADYSVEVERIRAALPEILARTPLWDRAVQNVQVTDATERTVQIRALVSARNSSDLFDLRCFVREALIAELRDRQPRALPTVHLDALPPALESRIARTAARG